MEPNLVCKASSGLSLETDVRIVVCDRRLVSLYYDPALAICRSLGIANILELKKKCFMFEWYMVIYCMMSIVISSCGQKASIH